MKTAGRHHVNAARTRYKGDKRVAPSEPDRIIIPVHGSRGSSDQFYRGLASMEYTNFEEIQAGSFDYDELAFQEFAGEDPTRLRVADRFRA